MIKTLFPTKRNSWVLLVLLFVFDNIVSYFAITRWGGREGNLAIASLVETYPLLYFLAIPVTVAIVWVIAKMILVVAIILLRNKYDGVGFSNVFERIILASLAIYWALANSSMNLAFLVGHRQPGTVWIFMQVVALITSLFYAILLLSQKRISEFTSDKQ